MEHVLVLKLPYIIIVVVASNLPGVHIWDTNDRPILIFGGFVLYQSIDMISGSTVLLGAKRGAGSEAS